MSPVKTVFSFLFLFCAGCGTNIRHRYCFGQWEGIPPETADEDIRKMFTDCAPKGGTFLNDNTRRYYAVYEETAKVEHNVQRKARQAVTKKIRADITGKQTSNIPLYDLKLFKHFVYEDENNHYWGIYYIPEMEYKALRKKYRNR